MDFDSESRWEFNLNLSQRVTPSTGTACRLSTKADILSCCAAITAAAFQAWVEWVDFNSRCPDCGSKNAALWQPKQQS